MAEYASLRESDQSRKSLVQRIRELAGLRRLVEEDVWHETVRVPLYRFAAPPVEKAIVTYTETDGQVEVANWRLKVFGVGTGDSQELDVSLTSTFVAENGACKLVFVPVRLRVARVRFADDAAGETGIRAQVVVPKGKDQSFIRGRGCISLSRADCRAVIAGDIEEDFDFPFAGDTSTSLHKVTSRWTMNVAHEVSLQLKRIVNVGPITRIKRTRALTLEMALPAGLDYRGHRSAGGMWWLQP